MKKIAAVFNAKKTLCLLMTAAFILTNLVLPMPAQAETISGPLSNDALRLKQYYKTIKDYLDLVIRIIDSGDYARDAIVVHGGLLSSEACDADYRGGSRCTVDGRLYYGQDSTEYRVYRMEVAAASEEYNNTNLHSSVLAALGNKYLAPERENELRQGHLGDLLAVKEDEMRRRPEFLFLLRRICQSPYQTINDRSYNNKLLTAYEKRNRKIIDSGKKYIHAALMRLEHELFWFGSRPAPQDKFRLARSASRFAYLTYKRLVQDLEIAREQKHHERFGELYNAYARFKNARAQAALSVNPVYENSIALEDYSQINILGTAQRIGWDKFSAVPARRISTVYDWFYIYNRDNPDQGVWRTVVENTFYEPQVGSQYYFCDNISAEVAALESKLNKNMNNYRVILDWFRRKLEAENQAYNAFKGAYQQLVNECNAIERRYRDLGIICNLREGSISERKEDNPSGFGSQYSRFDCNLPISSDPGFLEVAITRHGNELRGNWVHNNILANGKGVVESFAAGDKKCWIIRAIPDTENAKSKRYVLNQVVGAGETLDFSPDLAGDWQIELLVSRNLKAFSQIITVNNPRCILWINYANAPYDSESMVGINLELYNLSNKEKEYCQFYGIELGDKPYYIERMYMYAEVYSNYNDQGLPVDAVENFSPKIDPASMNPEKRRELFGIGASFYGDNRDVIVTFAIKFPGYEDLLPGDTFLDIGVTGIRHNFLWKNFVIGPNGRGGRVIFSLVRSTLDVSLQKWTTYEIGVPDPKITEVFINNRTIPFSSNVSSRRVKMHIRNNVDFGVAVNKRGRLTWIEKKSPSIWGNLAVLPDTPDWLEKRAVDALSGWRQEADVKRVLVNQSNIAEGLFIEGSRDIYLPYDAYSRFNLRCISSYGFVARATLDHVAKHEAFHAFHVNHKAEFIDADQDNLPGEIGPQGFPGGSAFLYTFDSPANDFGPVLSGQIKGFPTGISYIGDNRFDRLSGRDKHFLKKLEYVREPSFDVTSFAQRNRSTGDTLILLPLPPNLPIDDDASTQRLEMCFVVVKDSKSSILPLVKGTHYEIITVSTKRVDPSILVFMTGGHCRAIKGLMDTFDGQGYAVGELFAYYRVLTAHPLYEYDAERNSDPMFEYTARFFSDSDLKRKNN